MTKKNDSENHSSRDDSENHPKYVLLKINVYRKVLEKLRSSNLEEATFLPDFETTLWQHFSRLPPRYALDVKLERAEDVLTHLKLMKLFLEDPAVGIVLEVLPAQISPTKSAESDQSSKQPSNPALKEDDQSSKQPSGVLAPPEIAITDHHVGAGDSALNATLPTEPMHIINFVSTIDQKHQFAFLLAELGLNIQETHAFSSEDGLSLDIFVVDGWSQQETQVLKDVLSKEILKLTGLKIFFDSYKPKFSNRKPNKASIFDAPAESLRKHLVVGCSERLFKKLYERAEEDPSFALKLIRGASFIQRNKARLMSKLLMDKSCEYTHTRAFNKKFAALSVAKATATLSVAALFGVFVVGSGIIPAMEEKEYRALQLQELEKCFSEQLAEGLKAKVDKTHLESLLEDERIESSKLKERFEILEEAVKKSNSWFGWWSK